MRAFMPLTVVLLASSSMACADVIEIADDGDARILGALASDGAASAGAAATASDDTFDLAARRHGIDVGLLRAVAWTESRGRNDAVSPKGARGVMQLMPATAAELGVDPRDPVANINGGAAYLARQLTAFRNVPLALAAYNAGPGAVIRYRGVPPYAETRDYVAKLMQRWSGPTVAGASNTSAPAVSVAEPAAAAALPPLLIEVPEP